MPLKVNLQITFDRPNVNAIFEDLSDYLGNGYLPADISGLLKITYPDGIEQDFSLLSSPPLSSSNSFRFENALRTDIDGEIMEGAYTFVYKVYDSSVLVTTITRTLDFSYTPVTINVTQDLDIFTPSLTMEDATDYSQDGYSETVTRLFSYEAPAITTSTTISSSSSIDLSIGGEYYNTIYNVSLSSDIIYAGTDNDWFTLLDTLTYNVSVTPDKPLMIPEIIALVNCMFTKLKAMACCDDANYALLQADYEKVSAMFLNFVTNGQAGVDTNQSTLLSDMLEIFVKWGCADDGTISDTALASYDWCLCDGGSGGAGKFNYSAGNGAMVSSTVDNDVTFAKAAGVGTFTVASSTGHLLGATIAGSGADAAYTSGGATNSFKVVIPVKDASLAYATLLASMVQVWNATNSGSITDSTPLVLDEGAVQKRIVGVGSNTVEIVLAGIGATYSSGWLITFVNP